MELENVAGLSELKDALKQLPANIAKNVLRGGVSAGAAVVRKAARSAAPTFTGTVAKGHPPAGTLKRAIYQKQIPEKSGKEQQTFFVGVRKGKKFAKQGKGGNKSQDAFYALWVEFGTSKMAARPFMRPAFEAQKHAAVEAMKAYIAARIPAEVAKLKGAK